MKTVIRTVKIIAALFLVGTLFFSCNVKLVGPEDQGEYGTLTINLPGSEDAARSVGFKSDSDKALFNEFLRNVKYQIDFAGPSAQSIVVTYEDQRTEILLRTGDYTVSVTVLNAADKIISDKTSNTITIESGRNTLEVKVTLDAGGCDLLEIEFELEGSSDSYKGIVTKTAPYEIILPLADYPSEYESAKFTSYTASHTGARVEFRDSFGAVVDIKTVTLADLREYSINVLAANGIGEQTYYLTTALGRIKYSDTLQNNTAASTAPPDPDSVKYYSLYINKGYTYTISLEDTFGGTSPLGARIRKPAGLALASTTRDATTTYANPLTFNANTDGCVYIEVVNNYGIAVDYWIYYEIPGGAPVVFPPPDSVDKGSVSTVPAGNFFGEPGKQTTYRVTALLDPDDDIYLWPGTTIEFDSTAGIKLTDGAAIKIAGDDVLRDIHGNIYTDSSGDPEYGLGKVTLKGVGGAGWQGIVVEDADIEITYCEIDRAVTGLTLIGECNIVSLMGTVISNCSNVPIKSEYIGSMRNLAGITIENNATAYNYIHIERALSNYGVYMVNLDIPWYLESGLNIIVGEGSGVEMEAGIEVWVGNSSSIYVGSGTYLQAYGYDENRITIRGQVDTAGFWNGIVNESAWGIYLYYCDISGGGSDPTYTTWGEGACITISDVGYAELYDVTISKSLAYGIIYDNSGPSDIVWSIVDFEDIATDPNYVYNWDTATPHADLSDDWP